MTERKKRVFWGYAPYDYRATEKLLERMSEKGWLLSSCSPFIGVFTQCEPRRRYFRAAICDRQDPDGKSREKYIEQWQGTGMKHLCDYDRYFWFYTEQKKSMPDEGYASAEKYLLGSAVWRKEIYCALIMALAVCFGLIRLNKLSYTSFVSYSEFAKALILPLFGPVCIAIGLYLAVWMSRCRKRIKGGKRLKVTALSAAKLRRALVFVPVFLLFAILAAALVLDVCSGSSALALMLSPILLVVCVFFIVRELKKKGRAAILGRLIIIAALVVCIAVYALGNYRNSSNIISGNSAPQEAAQLGADHEIKSRSYVHTASPAVSSHYVYKETAADGSAANTEYFMCRNQFFTDLIYNKIRQALENEEPGYTLPREGNKIIYKEIKDAGAQQ